MTANPLPADDLPHTVTVTPCLGSGGSGAIFGTARTIAAFVSDERKVVRDRAGAEVVSESEVTVQFAEDIPTESLVTIWPGVTGERQATVITTSRHEHPDHWAYQTLSLT